MTRRSTPPEVMRRPNPSSGALLAGGIVLALAGVSAALLWPKKDEETAKGDENTKPETKDIGSEIGTGASEGEASPGKTAGPIKINLKSPVFKPKPKITFG